MSRPSAFTQTFGGGCKDWKPDRHSVNAPPVVVRSLANLNWQLWNVTSFMPILKLVQQLICNNSWYVEFEVVEYSRKKEVAAQLCGEIEDIWRILEIFGLCCIQIRR